MMEHANLKKYLLSDVSKLKTIILLCLFFLLQAPQTEALRSPVRSVRRCDIQSTVVRHFEGPHDCEVHCQQTYIRVSLDMIDWNEGLAQSRLEEVVTGPPGEATRATSCCCLFNAPWPTDLVKPESVGRNSKHRHKVAGKTECLPLLMSINLDKRTKESYQVMCQYLEKKQPLTMLELMKYAETARYLNFMQPKHPAIWKTLRLKQVSALDKEAVNQLRSVFLTELIDNYYAPIQEYGGYRLNPSQIYRYSKTMASMKLALRSRVVAESFDELVVSHVLVDMKAAQLYLAHVNHQQFQIPNQLLQGVYDKYDTKNKHLYFTVHNLDCKLLSQTKNKLSTYLTAIKSLLSSLYEKLIYEHILENYEPAIEVVHMETIYKNLLEVNCKH